MMRAALLVLVAACGASPPQPAPRPTTASGTIELLEDVAERACACKDAACAYTLDRELETTLAGLPTFLEDAAFAQGDAAIQRGITCLWDHEVVGWAYAELALSASTAVRDQTCACRDEACVEELSRVGSAARHLTTVPRSLDRKQSLDALDEATAACSDAIVDATPSMREAVAAKAQLCACKLGDAACGGETFAVFTTAATEIPSLSLMQVRRLKEHAIDAAFCLAKTGWKR